MLLIVITQGTASFSYRGQYSYSGSSSYSPSSDRSNSRPAAGDSEDSARTENGYSEKSNENYCDLFFGNGIQRVILQTPVEALSVPKVPSSCEPHCWAFVPCTGLQGPLWQGAKRSARPLWWLARLCEDINEGIKSFVSNLWQLFTCIVWDTDSYHLLTLSSCFQLAVHRFPTWFHHRLAAQHSSAGSCWFITNSQEVLI